MQIQVQDFPSDVYGETYGLRNELVKCLQRSCTSETGAKVFRETIKFTITKLKEADAIRAESQEALAAQLAEDAAMAESAENAAAETPETPAT